MNKKTELAVMPTEVTAEKLNEIVLSVIGQENMNGFRKAYVMAEAIKSLKTILTDEYMMPIMQLQGSRLGFLTDKDKNGGYDIAIVRNCLIEAVMNGLQPTGNQFNIIAGNMYPTKEGCGYKLNNFPGLKYQIIIGLPRLSDNGASAAVEAKIKWTFNSQSFEEAVPFPIRVNSGMGLDAIIGKATRKARAWLLSRMTGEEVTDGEVEDGDAKVMSSTHHKKENVPSNEEVEKERWIALIKDCNTVEELEYYSQALPEDLKKVFDSRMNEIKGAK